MGICTEKVEAGFDKRKRLVALPNGEYQTELQHRKLPMIRNLILVILAMTASAILPTSGPSQTDGTSLRWQFPVGRKLEVEINQRVKNVQNMEGQEITTAMSTSNFMNWKVDSFDRSSGVATINSKVDRVKMSMKSPDGEFEIDSDSERKLQGKVTLVGERLIAMVGEPFGQTMNVRGEVLAVDFSGGFERAAMVTGRETIDKLLESLSPVFPRNPISVGHSWTKEATTPMLGGVGSMQVTSTFTYKGREMIENRELEVIDFDMKTTLKTSEGSQATVEITDQSAEGKMYFDAANGHTTSMKVEQSITMDITIGGDKMNQTVESVTESTFTLAK